jgi:uncharacterized protein
MSHGNPIRARNRRRAAFATAAAAAAVLLPGVAAPPFAAEPTRPLELTSFPRTTLEIAHRDEHRGAHRYTFQVWVADTPERAEQGLMFVSDLPATFGMIFPIDPPRIEAMWMKNTYIELDMLFIAADGKVSKIIARAVPMSLKTLSSDVPVAAVLELRGGEAGRLGLRTGDVVSWKKPGS